MSSVQNSYTEGLVLNCLNRLELAKNKLGKGNTAAGEISESIRCLKEYMLTVRINRDVFEDMQKEITKLRKEKEAILSHHKDSLQNLEMLVYQNDQEALKARLTQFKAWEHSELDSLRIKGKDSSLSDSRLDRAFVLEEEENEFINCVHVSSKANSPIKQSLMIMNSPPLGKKAEVWMDIAFSRNSEEEANLHHVNRKTKQLSEFSYISPTELNEHGLTRQTDRQFSGQKVKSMILLKDKSKKGNSKTRTSVKKQSETHHRQENAEAPSHSKLKKKVLFPTNTNKPSQSNQKESGKKKAIKQFGQINAVRSFRKTLISNI